MPIRKYFATQTWVHAIITSIIINAYNFTGTMESIVMISGICYDTISQQRLIWSMNQIENFVATSFPVDKLLLMISFYIFYFDSLFINCRPIVTYLIYIYFFLFTVHNILQTHTTLHNCSALCIYFLKVLLSILYSF